MILIYYFRSGGTVARVCYRNTDSWHCTKVRVVLVTVVRLYRQPHQPLIFKKFIKKVFFLKERAFFIFDWRNWYQTDIKLISNWYQTDIKLISNWYQIFISNWLYFKKFEFSYQNKQKYKKKKFDQSLIYWKKNLIGEYGGFWSEFDPYTDRNAYQIPIKFSYQIHIKLRSVCLVG
jgi:hypothetical protein